MGERGIRCPGCGLILKGDRLSLNRRYNASEVCYKKYIDLSYYTMGKHDSGFIHQHVIDTYTAQHSGGNMKTISVAFALIGLYYAVEHHFTGRQVQRVHMLLSRKNYDWSILKRPVVPYAITVENVLNENIGQNRDAMIHRRMFETWSCWGNQHQRIKDICQLLLK